MQVKIISNLQLFFLTLAYLTSTANVYASGFVPTTDSPPPARSTHSGYRHIWPLQPTYYYENFERPSYVGKDELTIKFLRVKNGTILFGNTTPQNADKKNEFYCQQALSEIIPVPQVYGEASENSVAFPNRTDPSCKHDCKTTLFEKYSALQNQTVMMHIIPPSVLTKFPGLFTEDEIHGLKNLVGVDLKMLNSPELTFYRAEMMDFLTSPPTNIPLTRGAIISKTERLLMHYKKLFFYLDTVLPLFQKSYFDNNESREWMVNPLKSDDQRRKEARDAQEKSLIPFKAKESEKSRLTKAAGTATENGEWSQAQNFFEQFRKVDGDTSLIAEEVSCLEKLNQPKRIKELLNGIIKNHPDDLKAYRAFVDFYIQAGQPKDALALCDDFKRASKYDSDEVALLRSHALLETNNKKAAIDILFERYLHDLRSGADKSIIADALHAVGAPLPDKPPEVHNADKDAFLAIDKLLTLKSYPNGCTLACLFGKDFENGLPGGYEWSWQHQANDPDSVLAGIYVGQANPGNPALSARVSLNLQTTYLTAEMLAEKYAVPATEYTLNDRNKNAAFNPSVPSLRSLHKKLDTGGALFEFSAIDKKQLIQVTRWFPPSTPIVSDCQKTELDNLVHNVEKLIADAKFKEAREQLSAHWNDRYFGLDSLENQHKTREQKRKLFIATYDGEKDLERVGYLKQAPYAYITQDLANTCADARMPTETEYNKSEWFCRGAVSPAQGKNSYYKLGKPGYPCIRANEGTPLFKIIYLILGDCPTYEPHMLKSESIPSAVFDEAFFATDKK